MATRPLYKAIASALDARGRCQECGNKEWLNKHTATILALVKEHMPSGAGFDSGTKLDLDESTSERLVFYTSFHHMNEDGFYTNWTTHKVRVSPSLAFDFDLTVSGKNQNEIKDHIAEVFQYVLSSAVSE